MLFWMCFILILYVLFLLSLNISILHVYVLIATSQIDGYLPRVHDLSPQTVKQVQE